MPRKKKSTAEAPTEPIVVPSDLTDLITKWHAAKQQLDKAKEEENTLRQAIVASTFDGTKLEGTDSVEVGWGFKLKLTRVLAYNATNENHEMEQLLALLSTIDPALATGLVSWKPEVAKKVCRAAMELARDNPQVQAAFVAAITLKPGMPQLELVPAKMEESPVVIENIPA